ncbi:MAG: SDR family NAD(P)-dependent oxidoreductase [bacterium]
MTTKPTALITGANRGIGLETARQLGQLGYRVVVGARDAEKATAAAAQLNSEGIEAQPLTLDVADDTSVTTAAETARAAGLKFDALVNNAGIYLYGEDKAAIEVGLDTVQTVLDTNLFGALRVAQAFAPLLNDGARVVNVSSGMGTLSEAAPGSFAYRVSKTALNMATNALAADLKGRGIKVNSVCPGWVRTDMGGANAERPVEKGGASVVWAATLDADGPTGGFFRDGLPIPW